MINAEIREAHARLMDVHDNIRCESSGINEEILQDIYVQEQFSEVRKCGDGYTLWAVPSDVNELMDILFDTELVLLVGKFPYLSKNSVFNPHEKLDNINAWRKYINDLRSKLSELQSRQFSFWAWQNDCPVHGKTKSNAEANKKRLLCCVRKLKPLMQEQKEASRLLLTVCDEWLRSQGRALRVCVRWQPEKELDDVIERLSQRR